MPKEEPLVIFLNPQFVIPAKDQSNIRVIIEGPQGAGKTRLATFIKHFFLHVEICERQTIPLSELTKDLR